MGIDGMRPTRDMDDRQFVSRKEFNALLREVHRMSRLNVQSTAGGYMDMPGGRFIRSLSKATAPEERKRWEVTFDAEANVWTVDFDFLIQRFRPNLGIGAFNAQNMSETQRSRIQGTFKFNKVPEILAGENIIFFLKTAVASLQSTDPIIPLKWGAVDGLTNTTGADAITIAAQEVGFGLSDYAYSIPLIAIQFKGDGGFTLTHPFLVFEGKQEPYFDAPIDYYIPERQSAKLTIHYDESTRELKVTEFVSALNNSTVATRMGLSLIVPPGTGSNVFQIQIVGGFNASDVWKFPELTISGGIVNPPTIIDVTSRTTVARINTNPDGTLVSLQDTASTYIEPIGGTGQIEYVSSVNFGAQTVIKKTFDFGQGHITRQG